MGQNHGQGSFVRKNVEQTATDDNGVADSERLERRRQENAAANVSLQVNVVGDQQIVDHGSQNLVDFAGRRQQSNLLKALDGILLRLLFPHTLGDDGGCIGGGSPLVVHLLRLF